MNLNLCTEPPHNGGLVDYIQASLSNQSKQLYTTHFDPDGTFLFMHTSNFVSCSSEVLPYSLEMMTAGFFFSFEHGT